MLVGHGKDLGFQADLADCQGQALGRGDQAVAEDVDIDQIAAGRNVRRQSDGAAKQPTAQDLDRRHLLDVKTFPLLRTYKSRTPLGQEILRYPPGRPQIQVVEAEPQAFALVKISNLIQGTAGRQRVEGRCARKGHGRRVNPHAADAALAMHGGDLGRPTHRDSQIGSLRNRAEDQNVSAVETGMNRNQMFSQIGKDALAAHLLRPAGQSGEEEDEQQALDHKPLPRT